MRMTRKTANLTLLIISAIWGLGFILTKTALEANVTAGFINFTRGLIFTVLALIFFRKKIFSMTVSDFKIGLYAGLINFAGFITQTIGMKYTTPSNNAFITATYIVIIPFIAWIMYKKQLDAINFISIAICLLGMAVLTGVTAKGLNINTGDIYTVVCAFFYAWSIAYISHGLKNTDPTIVAFMMALTQMAGGICHFIAIEGGRLVDVNWQVAVLPLVLMGVFCSFTAQTFQVIAQQHTTATSAGLIMMLESVFGSLFSVIFGFEPLTFNMVAGGAIILVGLVITETKRSLTFALVRKFHAFIKLH